MLMYFTQLLKYIRGISEEREIYQIVEKLLGMLEMLLSLLPIRKLSKIEISL